MTLVSLTFKLTDIKEYFFFLFTGTVSTVSIWRPTRHFDFASWESDDSWGGGTWHRKEAGMWGAGCHSTDRVVPKHPSHPQC